MSNWAVARPKLVCGKQKMRLAILWADVQYEKNEREEFDNDEAIVLAGDGSSSAV